jgi:hypothetical protein
MGINRLLLSDRRYRDYIHTSTLKYEIIFSIAIFKVGSALKNRDSLA